jgi:hypothetical protein
MKIISGPKIFGQGIIVTNRVLKGVMSLSLSRTIFAIGLVMTFSGCGFRQSARPSALIILVESLSSQSVICSDDFNTPVQSSGFSTFCEESVRFTNAYTPSVQSQASISSILTGLYPFQHGVRHNGPLFLSAQFQTLPELLVRDHFRTGFFAGGAPVWKRSGLSQGFEVFDDNVSISTTRVYRTALENFNFFLSWLDKDVGDDPYFSVIYISDPQFNDPAGIKIEEESKEPTIQSQIQELDESLAYLHKQLSRRKRWDSTNIVIAGLNGNRIFSRIRDLSTYNLSTENTQVTLMIKPAQKKRDLGLGWKVDRNVSLIDLSYTLFEMFGKTPPKNSPNNLAPQSLKLFLENNMPTSVDTRWILSESGWPLWRGIGPIRISLRKNQYMLIPGSKWRIYNTLTDPYENSPLSEAEVLPAKLKEEAIKVLNESGIKPETRLAADLIDDLNATKLLIQKSLNLSSPNFAITNKKELKNFLYRHVGDRYIAGRIADYSILTRNWKLLKLLAEQTNQALWKFVAQRNLNQTASLDKEGCWVYFALSKKIEGESFRRPSPKDCDDESFVNLLTWISEKEEPAKKKALEAFLRLYRLNYIDQQVGRLNYINDLNWDVDLGLPREPSHSDLFLALPDFRSYRKIVTEKMNDAAPLLY